MRDDQQSVNQMLSHSVSELTHIARFAPELTEICNLLSEAQIQTEEAAIQLRRFLESQEADPQRMELLENQIGVIQSLSRKHHVTPDELPELVGKLEAELDGLTHSGERIETLKADTAQLLAQYHQLAAQLSEQRRKTGQKLQKQISAMIKELGMPQGEFLVDITALDTDAPKLNGKDKIEFLVSANPGLPPKPLAKVASGGELSRISLAIQVTTSNDKTTPTLIFDEVDSGIGGGVAEIVGQKLRSLSHNRQVMCVTHLPQVAAQAHHHLYVEKNNKTDITSSNVRLLNDEERVEEIARMLGGVTITANTLAHAKEMLFQSTSGTQHGRYNHRKPKPMTRFPAEWEKQSAVLIAWPHKTGDFSNRLESVEQSYSVIADTITQYQKLIIVCRDDNHQQHIQTLISNHDHIDFIHATVNDIWVRDTVFLSVEQDGAISHLNFLFNGWGEKYQHQNDNALNHKLLNAKPFKGKAHKDIDFILEGGSVESDGIDTILTTKQCLLNPE